MRERQAHEEFSANNPTFGKIFSGTLATRPYHKDIVSHEENPSATDHVRYINILTWLRGFGFSLHSSLLGELATKETLKICNFDPKALEPSHVRILLANQAHAV